jgi:hypothetical protein
VADAYQIKCSTARAYVQVLERRGKLAVVLKGLPSPAQAVLANLPLPSTWLDGEIVDGLLEQLHAAEGEPGLRQVVDEAMRESLVPGLLGVVQTVFRIVGTSPAFVYERFSSITKNHLRGADFAYRITSAKSGEMRCGLSRPKPLRPVWLLTHRLNLGTVLQICNQTGKVEAPVLSADGTSAVYKMSW